MKAKAAAATVKGEQELASFRTAKSMLGRTYPPRSLVNAPTKVTSIATAAAVKGNALVRRRQYVRAVIIASVALLVIAISASVAVGIVFALKKKPSAGDGQTFYNAVCSKHPATKKVPLQCVIGLAPTANSKDRDVMTKAECEAKKKKDASGM